MAALQTLLDECAALGPPGEDQEAQFSLAMPPNSSAGRIEATLKASVAPHAFRVAPAFQRLQAATNDRFWILAFPGLTALHTERLAFAAARELRDLLQADSVRPVLIDSLVGAAYGDKRTMSARGLCESRDVGPPERGWAPAHLGVRKAWKVTRGAGSTIASIDTGHSDHAELNGVISEKTQLNLIETDTPNDARDRFSTNVLIPHPGHGTLVASVAASRGDLNPDDTTDGLGHVTGVAPEATVLPIRAIRSVTDLRQSRIPRAIEHAITQECDIIVMALGSLFPIQPVEVALRHAVGRGMVVVCAAGNCVGAVVYPARFSEQGLTAAIAGVDWYNRPWEMTSKGRSVTVSAFGEGVYGARRKTAEDHTNSVLPSQGTTLAASLMAGAAALWMAAHGGRGELRKRADRLHVTVQHLFNEMVRASVFKPLPPNWQSGMGAGIVNIDALVNAELPRPKENLMMRSPVLGDDYVTPLRRLLVQATDELDSTAALEASGLEEDLAAEALWRLSARGARRRTAALTAQKMAPSGSTEGLALALEGRPHLDALLG